MGLLKKFQDKKKEAKEKIGELAENVLPGTKTVKDAITKKNGSKDNTENTEDTTDKKEKKSDGKFSILGKIRSDLKKK